MPANVTTSTMPKQVAPATVAAKPPPPQTYLNRTTFDLIETAPTNAVIRGLVRKEMGVAPPKDIKTTEEWTKWLDKIYPESIPGKNKPASPNQPYIDPDGNLVFPGATFSAVEGGTSRFQHNVTLRGNVVVPGEILRRGYQEVMRWLELNAYVQMTRTPSDVYEQTNLIRQRTATQLGTGTLAGGAAMIDWNYVESLVTGQ